MGGNTSSKGKQREDQKGRSEDQKGRSEDRVRRERAVRQDRREPAPAAEPRRDSLGDDVAPTDGPSSAGASPSLPPANRQDSGPPQIIKDHDPNPGKTALERLLWEYKLHQYYKALKRQGYDDKDGISRLRELAKDDDKFKAECLKVQMKLGHLLRLANALRDQ